MHHFECTNDLSKPTASQNNPATISLTYLGNIEQISTEFLELIHESDDACIMGKYWIDFLSCDDKIPILKVWHVYATTLQQEPLSLTFFWKNSLGEEIPLRITFSKHIQLAEGVKKTTYVGIATLNDYVE